MATTKDYKDYVLDQLNILPFCIGMLITYYTVAIITKGVYNRTFIIGWTIFALFSPIMAYFTWMTKEKGIFYKIISIGIIAVSILSSIILFDRLRVYDYMIDAYLIYIYYSLKKKKEKIKNIIIKMIFFY